MLGGMFKRKDKKSKGQEKDTEEMEKTSSEVSRQSPQPKESLESLTQEPQMARPGLQSQKQSSKLQKSPPTKVTPKSSYNLKESAGARPSTAEHQSTYIPEPSRAPPSVSEPNRTIQLVQPEAGIVTEDTAPALNFNPPVQTSQEPPQTDMVRGERRGVISPTNTAVKLTSPDTRPEQAQGARNLIQKDDVGFSSSEDEPNKQALSERDSQEEPERHLAIAQDAQHDEHEEGAANITQSAPAKAERLSESPIEVSPPQEFQETTQPEQQHLPHRPPPLMIDTSSQEDPSTSPLSPTSSPELVEAPNENAAREETPASTAQSSTPTWSDASLRAYMDDDSEIRDLLVVVHDKSNVKPARRDHPIVKKMYREENRKLGEISDRLDGLLGDYLARKSRNAVR